MTNGQVKLVVIKWTADWKIVDYTGSDSGTLYVTEAAAEAVDFNEGVDGGGGSDPGKPVTFALGKATVAWE